MQPIQLFQDTPKIALQELTELFIPGSLLDAGELELVISLDSSDLVVREFAAYLALVDGIYGRILRSSYHKYSLTQNSHVKFPRYDLGPLKS